MTPNFAPLNIWLVVTPKGPMPIPYTNREVALAAARRIPGSGIAAYRIYEEDEK